MSVTDTIDETRRTVLPAQHAHPTPRPPRRRVGRPTLNEVLSLVGAAAAGAGLASILFGRVAPLSGGIGWVVVAFLAGLFFYGVLVSFTSSGPIVRDRLMTTVLTTAAAVLFGALVFVVVFTILRGREALLFHANFLVEDMSVTGPLDPLTQGGVGHAIVGTLIQISIALAITVPLGIATAVYLNEVGGRFARFVRTIVEAMTALPSIIAGLFIYAAFISLVSNQRSGFAASLAITVMMLPIVIRASDVVLRLVPGNLREASLALGASRWRTVWHVVLPTARSGLVTAVILGTARGIGETSPVLLTSGMTAAYNLNPFDGPMVSLPLQVFEFVKSPEPNVIARGFGTAAVLMLLVLVLFVVARVLGGRPAGQLSARGARAAARDSARHVARYDARARERIHPEEISTS